MKNIIITLIITLSLIALVLSFSLPVIVNDIFPVEIRVVTGIVTFVLIIFIIRVLVERIAEIKEDDKDDLSKFCLYSRNRV